jgi:peptide deformylase
MPSGKIKIYGDPILRLKGRMVDDFGPQWLPLIQEMIEICISDEGAGLAAPQIGKSIQLALVYLRRENEEPFILTLFNPQLLKAEGECVFEEGCLSVPDIREEVTRPEKISLKYQDHLGKSYELEADGQLARVLQHEIDHLNGVLFVDRISPVRKALIKNKLKNIAAGIMGEEKETQ